MSGGLDVGELVNSFLNVVLVLERDVIKHKHTHSIIVHLHVRVITDFKIVVFCPI